MSVSAAAYLVIRLEDGFGDVFPLTPGQRYTLGRATTNRIVLKDALCSREHAEVFHTDGAWHVRDLNSLNGTRLNGERFDSEESLAPNDIVHLGRTDLIFVEDMGQLPDLPPQPRAEGEGVSIKKRLGQTRFLTPIPPDNSTSESTAPADAPSQRHSLGHDLSLLYRLALNMGSAADQTELVQVVLDGLLEAIPAEVGAILTVKEGGKLEVAAHRHRHPKV